MTDIVVIGFKTEYKGTRAVDWVHVAPSGEAFDRTKTWHRIKDVTPPTDIDDDKRDSLTFIDISARWDVIRPAYEAWKNGEDIPETGTPLAAWSGLNPEQASILRRMHIKTVEDVAKMSDSTTDKLPFPNARKIPLLAKDFLASKDKVDAAAELDAMRERVAVMEEMLAEASTKRGPGRPKKEEAEAA